MLWLIYSGCFMEVAMRLKFARPGLAKAGQYLDFKYSDDGTNVTLTGYTGLGCSVANPETIEEMHVAAIGNATFYGIGNLFDVEITSSATTVGNSAFSECAKLQNIVIPNGVTQIGDMAFAGCQGLTNVVIGSSVTNIGVAAFSGCSSLTVITVDILNYAYASVDGVLFDKSQTILINYRDFGLFDVSELPLSPKHGRQFGFTGNIGSDATGFVCPINPLERLETVSTEDANVGLDRMAVLWF